MGAPSLLIIMGAHEVWKRHKRDPSTSSFVSSQRDDPWVETERACMVFQRMSRLESGGGPLPLGLSEARWRSFDVVGIEGPRALWRDPGRQIIIASEYSMFSCNWRYS